MEEVKIDKRTREYKESVKAGQDMPTNATANGGYVPVCSSAIPDGTTTMEAIEPLHKAIKPDFSKSKDNPGFKLCMHCGCVLEYNDDGSVKRRVQPELCQACVWRNNG